MSIDEIQKDAEDRMEKSVSSLLSSLTKIRTGRAHPSLVENIKVEYYGQPTQLSQVANISIIDSRTLGITTFEKTMIPVVEKAIINSGMGLNPATSGQLIRIPLPPLTEERRKILAKQVWADCEDAKIAVRNVRRDANNNVKKLLKNKLINEDEEKRSHDVIQKMTDKFVAKLDEVAKDKEKEITTV